MVPPFNSIVVCNLSPAYFSTFSSGENPAYGSLTYPSVCGCEVCTYHMLIHTYSLDHLTVLSTAVQGWNACGWPICPWTPYSPTEVIRLVMTVWEGTCIHCPRHWLLGILVQVFTACLDCILCPRSGCAFPVFTCVGWVVGRSLTQQKWHTCICIYTNICELAH